MSMFLNKRSPCTTVKKIAKNNVLSPKSVTSYYNELKENNLDTSQRSIDAPDSPASADPASLNIVLNALKAYSKRGCSYSPKSDHDDEEICDFKNVGDLSCISFSAENSFREVCEGEDDEEEDYVDGGSPPSYRDISVKYADRKSVQREKSMDETFDSNDCDPILNDIQNLCQDFRLKMMQEKCLVEEERLRKTERNRIIVRQNYFQTLSSIRSSTVESLRKAKLELLEVHERQNKEIEKEQMTAKADSEEIEKNHRLMIEAEKKKIQEEIEALAAEEARLAALHQAQVQQLQQAQAEAQRIKVLESQAIQASVEVPAQPVPPGVPVQAASQAHTVPVQAASQAHTVPVQTVNPTATHIPAVPVASTPPKQATIFSPTVVSSEASSLPQTSQVASSVAVDQPQKRDSSKTQTSDRVFGERYEMLKSKYNKVVAEAESARNDVNLRPLLSRAVGIVNTFSNNKHDSSNRGKLQQLLNLLGGRSCTVGRDVVSIKANPSALAFVKEQLASRIIILSHDKQVAAMAVYASLIVRLWQLYPDFGELVLFKLYETCPFLAHRHIHKRDQTQTEQDYYKALGFRQKEDGTLEAVDKYLTRMGAAAQLYGRIVSMQVDNHPHGINEGWMWLSRTMNFPPYPSITASLLNGFLSSAGSPLLNQYGRQFHKLLIFLSSNYVLQIEKDVLEGGHSDTVGLRQFLSDFQRTRTIQAVSDGYKLLI